jgi:uncharacterized Zn-binding protein involved in type VI secretion
MKHQGRGVIRHGDSTTHGGQVITATGCTVFGRTAALAGDMTQCPQCKGEFAISAGGSGARHQGRPYAYNDDETACGAKLITSQLSTLRD